MLRWLLVLAVSVYAATAVASDPLEISPYHPVAVVTVSFGPADDQLGPYSPDWGKYEASAFPPFTVGTDGTLYLVDAKKNRVMIFSGVGLYQRSLPLLKSPSYVEDVVAYNDALYWVRGSLRRTIYRMSTATGDTLGIKVSSDPVLNLVAGQRVNNALKLRVTPHGISLWNPIDGRHYPIVDDGRIRTTAEQVSESFRRSLPDLPVLAFTKNDTVTTTGEHTHADVVLLDGDGRPQRIVAPQTSFPISVAGQYFLTTHCVDGSPPEMICYVYITKTDGEVVTHTLLPPHPLGRAIDLKKQFELAEDGTYYQLFLSQDGPQIQCHVVHWLP